MPQIINTNVSSLNTQRSLNKSQMSGHQAMQRLSSGLRINSAKDDSAGSAIASRMTAQISGLNQATRNANDGISLSQTAEGILNEVSTNLLRIRELAVQSANSTNSVSDRASLQAEVSQLTEEITRQASQAQFNGLDLLNGKFKAQAFQVGANANQTITVTNIADSRATALGSHTLAMDGTITGNTVTGSATVNGVLANVAADNFLLTTDAGATSPITYAISSGADAIALAINNAASSIGVTATAVNSTTLSGLTNAGVGNTTSFTLNGQAVSATITNQNDLSNLVSAINGVQGLTGVTASFSSTTSKSSLSLTTTDGRNIGLGAFSNTAGATDAITFGGAVLTEGGTIAAIVTGTISLSSSQGPITASTSTAGNLAQITASSNSAFTSVAALNITTAAGSQIAIDALDAALSQVNTSRGDLGAYQNRFSSAINNLQSTSENLSASRSRIQDADFAAESAELSRSQVLQQAGTAMLAQANQSSQGVLALLR